MLDLLVIHNSIFSYRFAICRITLCFLDAHDVTQFSAGQLPVFVLSLSNATITSYRQGLGAKSHCMFKKMYIYLFPFLLLSVTSDKLTALAGDDGHV